MFDERELKFELGDGEGLDLPPAVEKALQNMEKGEEALFTVKPKYVVGTHYTLTEHSQRLGLTCYFRTTVHIAPNMLLKYSFVSLFL